MLDKITKWEFLNEPAYRWAIFVGLMILILFMWRTILGHMKVSG